MTNTYRKYTPADDFEEDFGWLADDQGYAELDAWLANRASYAPTRSSYSPTSYRAPVRDTWEPSSLPTPILALDVDGPLSPFRMARKEAKRAGFRDVAWRGRVTYRRGSTWVPYSTLLLSRDVGSMLAEFSRVHDVELVWASMWEHNANTIIAPALGLPRLPVVSFHDNPVKGLWKFPAMAEYAAGRPLAWLDDGFDERRKVAQRAESGFNLARRNLPTLLHRVSPSRGIQTSDLDVVADWVTTARLAW